VKFSGNRKLITVPLNKLKNLSVCDRHFNQADLGSTGRRKPNVQPKLFPPLNEMTDEEITRWRRLVEPDCQFHNDATDSLLCECEAVILICNCSNFIYGIGTVVPYIGSLVVEITLVFYFAVSDMSEEAISASNSCNTSGPNLEVIPEYFVQGTFHQGDVLRFPHSHGLQCSAISGYAVAMASVSACDNWNAEVMDRIVTKGDQCFKKCFNNGAGYRYLAPDEVLKSYEIAEYQIDFSINVVEQPDYSIPSHSDKNLSLNLKNELELENGDEADFVALLLVSYSETIAIWRDKKEPSKYWLFDSHARDQNGKIDGDGKSFCGCFSSIEGLVETHYASHRDENGNIRRGQYQISVVSVKVICKSASVSQPHQDGETRTLGQDTGCSVRVGSKPSKKQKRKGKKQIRNSSRWSRRMKNLLDSMNVPVSENPTPVEIALAGLCEMLRKFAYDILKKSDHLVQKVRHLRKLSIREFLSDRGVSDYTIGVAECEARNNGRDCHGRRHTDSCKAQSIALQKAGGARALNVARQWTSALPSGATNRRSLKGVHIDIGLFQESSLMCHIGHLLRSAEDDMFKIVVVAFDETKMQRCLTPKPDKGYILGYADFGNGDRRPTLADQCLVFLVQGLVINWDFPAAVMFATSATSGNLLAELLPKFIRYIRSLGAKPVLTVCDQSTHNRVALARLTEQHPVIINSLHQKSQFEVDGEPVVCIYDPAHHIKCFRNAALGGDSKTAVTGSISWPITTDDGTEIMHELKWDMFQILRNRLPEGPLTRKLTDEHLSAKRRMKVKFATELFSDTNAALFESIGDSLTAKVVRDLDRLFDLCLGHSSRECADSLKEARKPMSSTSIHMEEFPGYLSKLERAKFWSYRRCGNVTKRFSSGTYTCRTWPHTILGLMALPDIVRKYNVSEFNVRSVGQCTLESNFSRYKEGRRYPTPQQILDGIQTTCIRGIVKPTSTSTNCEEGWSTREDTLMDFMRPVNREVSEGMPFVPLQVRYDMDGNTGIPVLSLPDESSVPAIDEVEENSLHQDALVILLASSIIKKLRRKGGMKCETCRRDLCSNIVGQVNSVALQMSSQILSQLPSEKFLKFVHEGRKEFQLNWQNRLHELDIYNKIRVGLTAETDCSWFSCVEHVGDLYLSLTEVFVADRVKLLLSGISPRIRASNKDPQLLQDMISAIGIPEQNPDDIDLEASSPRTNNTNPYLLRDMISAIGIPELEMDDV